MTTYTNLQYEGIILLLDYQKYSALLVPKMQQDTNAIELANYIHHEYIVNAMNLIDNKQYVEAISKYKEMVTYLLGKYSVAK